MNLSNLISNFGMKGTLASDVSFLILFILASFALSLILGKHRILVSLVGVYVAYAVLSFASFDFTKDPQMKTLLFLVVLISFIVMFSRIIRGSVSGHGPSLIMKTTIAMAIVVGFSLSIILNWYPAKDTANIIAPSVRAYFTGDLYKFLWAIGPLVYLGIVRKRID